MLLNMYKVVYFVQDFVCLNTLAFTDWLRARQAAILSRTCHFSLNSCVWLALTLFLRPPTLWPYQRYSNNSTKLSLFLKLHSGDSRPHSTSSQSSYPSLSTCRSNGHCRSWTFWLLIPMNGRVPRAKPSARALSSLWRMPSMLNSPDLQVVPLSTSKM